jgi:hypothetical protein
MVQREAAVQWVHEDRMFEHEESEHTSTLMKK